MIVAGFGFRGAATVESLRDALSRAHDNINPTHFATARDKADTPAFQSFAKTLGAEIISVDSTLLTAQQTTTQSAASQAAHGTGSVAEAAALAAAGPGAKLLAPRAISGDRKATCALAEGDAT
ncbi:cobalamin biosynthesis protein [Roseovarius aestuarii]|uniref:Cobalamin biosynthesis protein CbiG n=1 Tax=Roseovarius aestuarii TaxID=475083 RepID=A0A1X7BQZ6_9RHOB|nr:cobalamin biosynthesis protein [Roseovarius aestuarii]SMC12047.1 cobalamin biosynthesis protein CbiG [Roseovarius aestuarii]